MLASTSNLGSNYYSVYDYENIEPLEYDFREILLEIFDLKVRENFRDPSVSCRYRPMFGHLILVQR